jgi:hypothetical protein
MRYGGVHWFIFVITQTKSSLTHFHLSFSIFHFTALSAGTCASQYFHLKIEFWINLLIWSDCIIHPRLNISNEIQPQITKRFTEEISKFVEGKVLLGGTFGRRLEGHSPRELSKICVLLNPLVLVLRLTPQRHLPILYLRFNVPWHACVWSSNPRLGRKKVTLFSDFNFKPKNRNMQLQPGHLV